jgi:hypothetical protein
METGERNKWIGIILGACVMAAGPFVGFFRMDTTLLIIILLIGGFIAGIFSPGEVKDGIYSGVMSGLIGSFILAIYIAAILIILALRGPVDEGAGMLVAFGVLFGLLAMLLGSVGAVVGVMVRRIANVNKKNPGI